MFAARTGFYLRDVSSREEKEEDGTTRKCMVLSMQLQPFTADQANELNIKTRLFDSRGEAHPDVLNATLSVDVHGLQSVTFFRAPDAEMPQSLTLRNVTVESKAKVRKDGETPQYSAGFILVTDGMPGKDALLYLFEGQSEQHFLTFENEQGDLLENDEQAAERAPTLSKSERKKMREAAKRLADAGTLHGPEGEISLTSDDAPGRVQ
jgi:hypothetical protein